VCSTLRRQQKAPSSGAFLRADEGARTLGLLHGKRVVDRAPNAGNTRLHGGFLTRSLVVAEPRYSARLRGITADLGTRSVVVPNAREADRNRASAVQKEVIRASRKQSGRNGPATSM
jgi:hypothetical protein